MSARERLFLAVGSGALLLFLLYLLVWRGGDEAAGPVELAVAPPPPAAVASPLAPSAPLPVVSAPPVYAPAAPAMVLQGVSGGGPGGGAALIRYQDGTQRLIRVGREIAPGTVLKGVGLTWAIAGTAAGEVRLDLNRPGITPVVAAPAVTTAPVQAEQRETSDLRLGLQPVSPGGRAGGYLVRAGPHMARLAQAGLQPGDIIIRVNGSTLDEERLLELSWQMTNARRTEFDVIRKGKPLKLTLGSDQSR